MKNIKTKFIQVVLISLIGLIITGCSQSKYSVKPKLDETNQKLVFNDLILDDFLFISQRKVYMGNEIEYVSKDKKYHIKALERTLDITTWPTLHEVMKNGISVCKYTGIDSIEFFECENKKMSFKQYIVSQTTNGYKTNNLLFVNDNLFYKLKSFFSEKAKLDNIEVKTDIVGSKEFSEKANLYKGSYNSTCSKFQGLIELLEYDNKFYGYTSRNFGFNRISAKAENSNFFINYMYDTKKLDIIDGKISGEIEVDNCDVYFDIKPVEKFPSDFLFKGKVNTYPTLNGGLVTGYTHKLVNRFYQ